VSKKIGNNENINWFLFLGVSFKQDVALLTANRSMYANQHGCDAHAKA